MSVPSAALRRRALWTLAAVAPLLAGAVPFGPLEREVRYEAAPAGPSIVSYAHRGRPDRWCLVLPHENEQTAFFGAIAFAARRGGTLLRVEQNGVREIDFGDGHGIDPNRIATPEGRRVEMASSGVVSEEIRTAIGSFAERFVAEVEACASATPTGRIVALHNNRHESLPGDYGIRDYEGGMRSSAAPVPGNPSRWEGQSPDDFFLVTRPEDFEALRGAWNAVLQHPEPPDDGSLSVVFKDAPYVNVETGFGHTARLGAMLDDLARVARGEGIEPPRARRVRTSDESTR